MSTAIMDISLSFLMEIRRLYLPIEEMEQVGAIFSEGVDGIAYRFSAMMGSDQVSGDTLLVMKRDVAAPTDIPPEGKWIDVYQNKTELLTIRRFLGGYQDSLVEELVRVQFHSSSSTINFFRERDAWGDWTLHLKIEPAAK